jgi:hypothetical protein
MFVGMNPCPAGYRQPTTWNSYMQKRFNEFKSACRAEFRNINPKENKSATDEHQSSATLPVSACAVASISMNSLYNCEEAWTSATNQVALSASLKKLRPLWTSLATDDFIKEQLKTVHKGKLDKHRRVAKITVMNDAQVAEVKERQGAAVAVDVEEKHKVEAKKAESVVSKQSRHAAARRRVHWHTDPIIYAPS